MDVRAIEKLELNKILNGVASYATLPETRALISATISINGMAHLQQVIDRLSKIRGVISIDRS